MGEIVPWRPDGYVPAEPGLPLPCDESFVEFCAVGIAHGFDESCALGFCPAARVHGFDESVIGTGA